MDTVRGGRCSRLRRGVDDDNDDDDDDRGMDGSGGAGREGW